MNFQFLSSLVPPPQQDLRKTLIVAGATVGALWFGYNVLIESALGRHILLFRCKIQARISMLAGNSWFFSDYTNPRVLHRALSRTLGSVPQILSVETTKDGTKGGYVGAMQRLFVTYAPLPDGTVPTHTAGGEPLPKTLMVKRNGIEYKQRLMTILLRTPREAVFYRTYATVKESERELGFDILPRVYAAKGSYWSGNYEILMDFADNAINCSHALGNQCWGSVDLPPTVEKDQRKILEAVFLHAADFHARFWKDKSLLSSPYLKGTGLLKGKDRARWELGMEGMRRKWAVIKKKIEEKKTKVAWSPLVIKAIDDSLRVTSWSQFKKQMQVAPSFPGCCCCCSNREFEKKKVVFTLTHGDFHAGNMLWNNDNSGLKMVDWAEVGVFCPFTELAQFVVSNATVPLRRQNERALFEAYYQRLVSLRPEVAKDVSLEEGWSKYKKGGIERWVQMLVILAYINHQMPQALPEFGIEYFHAQTRAFLEDHLQDVGGAVPLMSAYCLID